MPCIRLLVDNPIPTSLFMSYAAVVLFVGTGDAILMGMVACRLRGWKLIVLLVVLLCLA